MVSDLSTVMDCMWGVQRTSVIFVSKLNVNLTKKDPGLFLQGNTVNFIDENNGNGIQVLNKKQTIGTQYRYHFSPLLRRYLHLKDLLHFGKRIRMRIKVQGRIHITVQPKIKTDIKRW